MTRTTLARPSNNLRNSGFNLVLSPALRSLHGSAGSNLHAGWGPFQGQLKVFEAPSREIATFWSKCIFINSMQADRPRRIRCKPPNGHHRAIRAAGGGLRRPL